VYSSAITYCNRPVSTQVRWVLKVLRVHEVLSRSRLPWPESCCSTAGCPRPDSRAVNGLCAGSIFEFRVAVRHHGRSLDQEADRRTISRAVGDGPFHFVLVLVLTIVLTVIVTLLRFEASEVAVQRYRDADLRGRRHAVERDRRADAGAGELQRDVSTALHDAAAGRGGEFGGERSRRARLEPLSNRSAHAGT